MKKRLVKSSFASNSQNNKNTNKTIYEISINNSSIDHLAKSNSQKNN